MGDSTAFLSGVAEDAFVWTGGDLSGSVSAGQDVLAISLGQSLIGVLAGRDAYVLSFGDRHSSVIAGRDAMVFTWGGATGGVTATRDASLYAVDYAIGNLDAGRYASLVTWGTAAGPFVLDGDAGAFGWVYRDFNGDVTSSAGSAMLTVYGNAVGNVLADGYASLYVVGDFVGIVTAGESATAVALTEFHGGVTAGASAAVLSEGDVNAHVTAGEDLYAFAGGDLWGTYSAGRDAAAYTYGNFNAGFSANRDIVSVETGGYLSGAITAGRNIGVEPYDYYYDYPGIIARGKIDAAIVATDSGADGQGGKIGSIIAWNDIDGLVSADQSVAQIRAGGTVNAQVTSPSPPSITEFDPNVQTDYPAPPPLESIIDDLLTDAAAVRQLVLDDRDDEQDAIDAAFAQWKSDKQEMADELADLRFLEKRAVRETAGAAQQAQADALLAAQQRVAAEQAAARASYSAVVQAAAASEAELAATRDAIRAARQRSYDAALNLSVKNQKNLDLADKRETERELRHQADSAAEIDGRYDVQFVGMDSDSGLYWGDVLYEGVVVGMEVSLRAVGNAFVDTVVSFVSVGQFDNLETFGAGGPGYDAAYLGARVFWEIVAGLATGGASALSKAGWAGRAVQAIRALDAAGNVRMVAEGAYGFVTEGFTVENTIQTLGGAAGLGGNAAGRALAAPKAADPVRATGAADAATDSADATDAVRGVTKAEETAEVADAARVAESGDAAPVRLTVLQKTCFTAGTPVLTPSGEKTVEQFQIGDAILSRPENAPSAPARASFVEQVFELSAPVLELRVGGRTIETTAEHPFFVWGKGWVRASELKPGDLLAGRGDERTPVQEIAAAGRVATVYNLRVAEDHTYFVGRRSWGFSVWVHNTYTARQAADGTWEIVDESGVAVRKGLTESEAVELEKALNFGINGVQTPSKTVYNKDGVRIDFENPNPGQRAGQIHVQVGNEKYLYDPLTGSFFNLSGESPPKSLLKIINSEEAQNAIQKALRMLGEI